MNTPTNKQAGFTLIEMMIVVAIIGILLAMITPNLFNQLNKAETVKTHADLRQIDTQLKFFYIDNRRLPTRHEGLEVLVPDYFTVLPVDSYGNRYHYVVRKSKRFLVATGSDGVKSDDDIKLRVQL